LQAVYIENLKTGELLQAEGLDLVFHPASLLKLFTAVAARKKFVQSGARARAQAPQFTGVAFERIEEAIKASLKTSDNDALHYIVDFISDTESGLELEGEVFQDFVCKRNKIHDYFPGYSQELKIPNKCFECDYYGRDRQLVEIQANQCTIRDVAMVMKEIYNDFPDLLEYMKRQPGDKDDYQASNFLGAELGLTEPFYSKAGWNSRVWHDACIYANTLHIKLSNRGRSPR